MVMEQKEQYAIFVIYIRDIILIMELKSAHQYVTVIIQVIIHAIIVKRLVKNIMIINAMKIVVKFMVLILEIILVNPVKIMEHIILLTKTNVLKKMNVKLE